MPKSAPLLAALTALALATAALPARAEQAAAPAGDAPSLEALLQQFDTRAETPQGSVRLDAWVETGKTGKEIVVLVEPEGATRLVADPGITVTPAARAGVEWQVPLPYRLVDTDREYFDPPATVRLPFTGTDGQPLELLVEYAYCFVDFQCFLGEAELTVADTLP